MQSNRISARTSNIYSTFYLIARRRSMPRILKLTFVGKNVFLRCHYHYLSLAAKRNRNKLNLIDKMIVKKKKRDSFILTLRETFISTLN